MLSPRHLAWMSSNERALAVGGPARSRAAARTSRFPLSISKSGEYVRGTSAPPVPFYRCAQIGRRWACRTWKKGGTVRVLAFFRDDEGQGLVEYALIIAVIAIAVIVAMIFLRGQLQNIFSNIGNNLT